MTKNRRYAGLLLLSGVALAPPALAQEASSEQEVKLACARAFESAQRLRKESSLVAARKEAVACAQSACPGVLSTECSKWVTELDGELPTLVFELRDAQGKALPSAEISIDEGPFEAMGGAARQLDPGPHVAKMRSAEGETAEISFQATAGQKNVLVSGSLQAAETSVSASDGRGSPIPTTTWILGGTSLVSFGVFGALAISGKTQQSSLEDDCSAAAPCNRSRGEAIKRTYLGADIALGVGIATLGAGLTWWLLAPRKAGSEQVALGLEARPSGSTLSLSGRF